MAIQKAIVTVKKLTEVLHMKTGRPIFGEIQNCMNVDRPRVVLDCSALREIDMSVIQLLLCCLEEAMKRNGDVALAAVPPGASTLLEATGANHLFNIFDTATDAANGFHQFSVGKASQLAAADAAAAN